MLRHRMMAAKGFCIDRVAFARLGFVLERAKRPLFEKKRRIKLLLRGARGIVADSAHGPHKSSFLLLFVHKKKHFLCQLNPA
jgi:hypothetical protein